MIFNEYEFALELLKHGFTRFMSLNNLTILAKYYKYLGKNKKQIEKELLDFCEKWNPGFNSIVNRWSIDISIKNSREYSLRFPIEISITEKELEIIKNVNNYKFEKILFVLLVCAKNEKYNKVKINKKSENNDFFVNISFLDILKLAKIHISKEERNKILFELNNLELIKTTCYGSFKINYINENSDIVLSVLSDDNMIEEYKKIKGDITIRCVVCGNDCKANSNRQKMCKKCARKVEKEKTREYVRTHRNKK
jgi:hypothetical protein